MILALYIPKRGQKLTKRDVIKAIFPKIEALPNPETTSWLDRPFDLDQVKGAYSIPIDPPKYKVDVDINNFPKMEKDPIGEEIERQFKLRAAQAKTEKTTFPLYADGELVAESEQIEPEGQQN